MIWRQTMMALDMATTLQVNVHQPWKYGVLQIYKQGNNLRELLMSNEFLYSWNMRSSWAFGRDEISFPVCAHHKENFPLPMHPSFNLWEGSVWSLCYSSLEGVASHFLNMHVPSDLQRYITKSCLTLRIVTADWHTISAEWDLATM